MKFACSLLMALTALTASIALAKENRKPASECNYGSVQEEIYVVFHDADPRIVHTDLSPEDKVTFGQLGVTPALATKLAGKIDYLCGTNSIAPKEFGPKTTLLTVYKKLHVYLHP